jgi:hypothetical protein
MTVEDVLVAGGPERAELLRLLARWLSDRPSRYTVASSPIQCDRTCLSMDSNTERPHRTHKTRPSDGSRS